MTDRPLTDRTAIVTGGSSGIGHATARTLARDGAAVVLAARRVDRLEAIADTISSECPGEAIAVPTDVQDVDAVDTLIDMTVTKFEGLDILVNNAGLAHGSTVEELTTEEFHDMQATNVDGVFYATRAALPHLRDAQGNLIFIGSFAGQYPRSFNPVYAATKWWTRGFALSVAAQVGEAGVGVTVVNPSEVRTEFEVEGETFADRFEPGSVTEPEEVGEAVAFAAKQRNSTVSELDLFRRDKFSTL